jgi:phage shock protein A
VEAEMTEIEHYMSIPVADFEELHDRIKQADERRESYEREARKAIRLATHRADKLSEALGVIAFADTHYPSMPSGFTGDWKALRDFAREELQKLDPEGFAKWEVEDGR